jgi:hypothetical protein
MPCRALHLTAALASGWFGDISGLLTVLFVIFQGVVLPSVVGERNSEVPCVVLGLGLSGIAENIVAVGGHHAHPHPTRIFA